MVLHLWFTWKCWCQGEMSPAVWYWQAATYAAYALKISWKLRRKGTTLPFVGQPLVAALRLTGLGLGLGAQSVWLMVHRSMAAAAAAAAARPAGGAGGARDAVRLLAVLLFASSGVAMMMGLVTLRVAHLSLSAAAQLGLVASALPSAAPGCRALMAGRPDVQRSMHAVHSMVSWLAALPHIHPGASPGPATRGQEAVAECVAVVSFFQIGIGLVLPLLLEARLAACLFHRHQRQRRAAGLPPERGPHAAAYRALWRLLAGDGSLPFAATAALLLIFCWDLCNLYSFRGAGGAAAASAAAGAS